MIMKRLQNKRIFIVLDNVDSDEQTTTLAGDWKWFSPGSKVIITSRDSHLLIRNKVNDIYKVEQLETAKALQLFSLSAFDKTHPPKNYMDLSMDFVRYAQGLPLALKVLRRHVLFGRTNIDTWKSVRNQLEAIPNKKIMDVLQISLDGLQEMQKELFLDMACFFRGQHWVDYKFFEVLESFGHYHIDIDVLVENSLISKSKYGLLSMHDLLKELGREIVRCECPDEYGKRSRLFCWEDLCHVLKNDTGTDATKGIVVNFCPETKERLNAKAFSKMTKLRYVKFHHSQTLKWRGNPLKYMPTNELRYLEWSGYPLKSWPSSFQPKNLTVLRMSGSRIKQLWKGSMVLDNLKEFDVSFSKNLIETPDLTRAPNLEKINLEGCKSLCEVHPSIGSRKRLKNLQLQKCSSLEKLPELSKLEWPIYFEARETAITQIPSFNLLPKGFYEVRLEGRKLMRDPTYDIGSLVEYQIEGKFSADVVCIDFDSKREKILDMASGIVGKLYGNVTMISGWSLGFNIPEWVRYKSNGSSVTIDLDGITNPEMGCAFFIVCDSDKFFSLDEEASIYLFKEWDYHFASVSPKLSFERDEEECREECSFEYFLIPRLLDDCLIKTIGFWVYIPAILQFLRVLDIWRRLIKISFETGRYENGSVKFNEAKECGVHLVCPDDGANSEFFNSIAPFRHSGSSDSYSNSDFHHRYSYAIYENIEEAPWPDVMIRRVNQHAPT
ncbi:disease resistance protein RUN1-like [Carya illinoinensis]|uniref:disease resistance protein RUN1-like n=1 Tax=Carya illinoinensis TaxID=32201 RepID=UPI001C71F733|nr:disease resistance protein RUN1-like [Carya illinoinensis]